MQRITVLIFLLPLFWGNSFGWVDPASKIKKVTANIKLASIRDKETGELKTYYDDCAFKVYNGEGRVIYSYGSKKESVETPCRAYTVAETPDYVIIVNENSSSAKKCKKLEYDGNTWNTYPLGNCTYTRHDCIRPKMTCSNGVNQGWRNYQEIVKKNAGLVSERKVLENSFEAEVGKNVIELYFDRKIQLEGDQVTYRGKVYRLSKRDHQMLVRFILRKADHESINNAHQSRFIECEQGRLPSYALSEEEIASGRCDPVEIYTIFDAYEDECNKNKKDCAPLEKEVVEYANKMCAKGEKSYCKSVQEKNKAENLARKKAADIAEKKARERAEKERFLESYDSDRDGFCLEGYEESSLSNLCQGLDLCPGLSGTSPDGCTEEVRVMRKEEAKETIELQIRQLFDCDADGFCSEEFDKWGGCAEYAAASGIKENVSFKNYTYFNPFLSKAEAKAAIAEAKEKVCTKGYIDACPYNWGRSMGCERNAGGKNYDNSRQNNGNGLFVNGKKVKFKKVKFW